MYDISKNELIEKIKERFKISNINNFENELTISVYNNEKNILKAIDLGKKGIEIDRNDVFFWRFLGYSYALKGDIKKYIQCYDRVVTLDPDDYRNWISISFAYRSKGEILTSNWINYNVEYFMQLYLNIGFNEMNFKNLMLMIEEIRKNA